MADANGAALAPADDFDIGAGMASGPTRAGMMGSKRGQPEEVGQTSVACLLSNEFHGRPPAAHGETFPL